MNQKTRVTLAMAFALLGACAHRVKISSGRLTPPGLVAPRDQTVFTNHPRTVRFAWSRVPQAASYGIEIDCYGCCARGKWCSEAQGMGYIVPHLTAITYTFTFWGDQRGRWRVWAADAKSRLGPKSAWSGFSFRAETPASNSTDTKKPSPFGGPARR